MHFLSNITRNIRKLFQIQQSINAIAYFDLLKMNRDVFGGFVYVMLRPFFIVIALVLVIGTVRKGYSFTEGLEYFLFPISLFYFMLELISKTNFLESNISLTKLSEVNEIILLFGKIVSSVVVFLLVFFAAYAILDLLGVKVNIVSFITLIIMSIAFGASYHLFFSVLLFGNNELREIHAFLVRALIFISCVIFPLEIFSKEIQIILLYNPIVHIMEYGRLISTNITGDSIDYLSIEYVFNFSLTLTFLSIILLSLNIKKRVYNYKN